MAGLLAAKSRVKTTYKDDAHTPTVIGCMDGKYPLMGFSTQLEMPLLAEFATNGMSIENREEASPPRIRTMTARLSAAIPAAVLSINCVSGW